MIRNWSLATADRRIIYWVKDHPKIHAVHTDSNTFKILDESVSAGYNGSIDENPLLIKRTELSNCNLPRITFLKAENRSGMKFSQTKVK